MKKRAAFLIVVGARFGCSAAESNRDRPAPMPLAFRQESEADVVLDFLNWNHWRFSAKSGSELPDPPVKTRESLSSALESRSHGKKAVVIFDKVLKVHEEDVLALEAIFKKAGFRSLVVQQGVGLDGFRITTGRPILKEVEFHP